MLFTKDRKGHTQINFFPMPTAKSHPSYQLAFGAAIGALTVRRLIQGEEARHPKKARQEQSYETD